MILVLWFGYIISMIPDVIMILVRSHNASFQLLALWLVLTSLCRLLTHISYFRFLSLLYSSSFYASLLPSLLLSLRFPPLLPSLSPSLSSWSGISLCSSGWLSDCHNAPLTSASRVLDVFLLGGTGKLGSWICPFRLWVTHPRDSLTLR